jgi:hypothetical protein
MPALLSNGLSKYGLVSVVLLLLRIDVIDFLVFSKLPEGLILVGITELSGLDLCHLALCLLFELVS